MRSFVGGRSRDSLAVEGLARCRARAAAPGDGSRLAYRRACKRFRKAAHVAGDAKPTRGIARSDAAALGPRHDKAPHMRQRHAPRTTPTDYASGVATLRPFCLRTIAIAISSDCS